MNRSPYARCTVALLVIGSALALAAAARQPGTQPVDRAGTALTVQFPGGPLANYIAALRSAAGAEPVNVIVSGQADVALPPIALQRVSVQASVALLEHLNLPEHQIRVSDAPNGSETPVFVVGAERRQRLGTNPQEPGADLAVFAIRSIIETPPGTPDLPTARTAPDALLTAVQTALNLAGPEPTEIKYHPESGVLVIRGTGAQTGAVHRLLGEVKADLHRVRKDAFEAAERSLALDHDVRIADVQHQSAENELRVAEEAFRRFNALIESGAVSEDERGRAELELARRRSQVEESRAHLERAAAARSLWQSRGPGPGGLTPDDLRREIKRAESTLDALRAELKKLEGTPAR